MNIVQIIGLVLVVGSLAVTAWVMCRVMHNVAWLMQHEEVHCRQIGELQHHVSTLALILDNALATPLPRELMDYAEQVRGE